MKLFKVQPNSQTLFITDTDGELSLKICKWLFSDGSIQAILFKKLDCLATTTEGYTLNKKYSLSCEPNLSTTITAQRFRGCCQINFLKMELCFRTVELAAVTPWAPQG